MSFARSRTECFINIYNVICIAVVQSFTVIPSYRHRKLLLIDFTLCYIQFLVDFYAGPYSYGC
jgi:hypothetical protein